MAEPSPLAAPAPAVATEAAPGASLEPRATPLEAAFAVPSYTPADGTPAVAPPNIYRVDHWAHVASRITSVVCSAGLTCTAAVTAAVTYWRGRIRRSARFCRRTVALPSITGPRELA
jgi:hypothetical protein